ncbi:MAG: NAD(+) kinase [Gammaproteobacteria bacterium]|nr:NAD(+) kinase [Gammaproteobacteria bacterium]
MAGEFSTIGLIGKYGESTMGETLVHISEELAKYDCSVMLEDETASKISNHKLPTASLEKIGNECDLAIIVGGDGTLLNAARNLIDYNVPILGINLGRLGFLVDISPDEIGRRFEELFDGKYEVEHRIMLNMTVEHQDGRISKNDAFNDVVVHKWDVARMIETETFINGKFLNTMRADGLIVSTPTGSTAYALSGGGPILQPDLDALVLVPICPHTMSFRPIVIDGESKIELHVKDSTDKAQVTCDGQTNFSLVSGDKVIIERKSRVIRLIHPCKHDHYEILRAKLRWGENF